MEKSKKQTVFSGIQPSGNLHIGNYLGAIKQFVRLQDETDALFCIVDEHAITVPQDPRILREKTLEVAMLYLAAGIDPKKAVIFIQSQVPAHAELGWILNTMTPLGELERMTQFKDKSAKSSKAGILAGLLNYPTLMAADILLYQTDLVPVGKDQKQHVELTRSIAERFNNRFGQTFKLPKELLNKQTARIMGLDNAEKKMSKSAESKNNHIALLDTPDEIRRKIKIAVTDSGSEIKYALKEKPAISNLVAIYSEFSDKPISDIEKMYFGKGYGDFKKDLAEVVVEGLKPLQEKFKTLEKDPEGVLKILRAGAKEAAERAGRTIKDVKKKLGFVL
ncbi:MAG: tryptophan--tRNA ligase [Candidatus Sungbacteria bacterium RIFCSPLOWO2_02_FULL_47_9]|uniref:Tryptophan--tRNA ligase n=1 Tax=Candidatus Sungbacteria bacterium RIFCSPHIGHO2_01_FULL_47_32 TaxID=1802264 RepID=A0A1G2K8N0_9BACT|nr:MAG: Tryptophan-tRNA ligase [Parcubacteria group bacterium GW2011_GWA2_47_10]OGZ95824.1 MAG: tryptophan--tRNA ligase [Candidatus Sungbacteria bacterium RIFCSPHIGHO2_01_FULL_47_32]OGZ98616.1 MAG: tryptophan--tRNA ligase [Candidatus Sungbacteria bacterium RIFCSPHIGHO2_02_FULL_46_12]OHA04421.1 MAG: tryptophan--tRNA ligase [Candidatus Sungbacteria bacterium RIFCSPLOWO2_01_FULL_47_32]OHA11785.1 MAG: tryptophan--tRNA ligase [Candidatus Sungbacteria bacterium RIFCSPLOWO2_02_FULL_47_9]